MQKGLPFNWRQIGHFEKAFIAFILLYIVMYVAGAGWLAQASVGLIGVILGRISLVRLARTAMRYASEAVPLVILAVLAPTMWWLATKD